MTRFEYEIETVPTTVRSEEVLAGRGQDRWELCAVLAYDDDNDSKHLYFKRALRPLTIDEAMRIASAALGPGITCRDRDKWGRSYCTISDKVSVRGVGFDWEEALTNAGIPLPQKWALVGVRG